MNRHFFLFALAIAASAIFASSYSQAQTPLYKQQFATYKQLCDSLNRTTVDCACVAKSHATYAHLSPNQAYRDYLVEFYKENIGLPNRVGDALQDFADGEKSEEDAHISIFNAFGDYESPFTEEIQGCVIPNSAPIEIPALPSPPIYKEVFDYRVRSTYWDTYERCGLVETSKVLEPQELAALHYVYSRGLDDNTLSAKMKMSATQVRALADKTSQKFKDYEENTRRVGDYCAALLRAQDMKTGELDSRYARSATARAGTPVGLEGIDTTKPRPSIDNKWQQEQDSVMAEVQDVKQQQASQPNADQVLQDAQNSSEYQTAQAVQQGGKLSGSAALITKGCKGSGYSDAFCSCFVEKFGAQIGIDNVAAALPVIQGGLSDVQSMQLLKGVDQSALAQHMMTTMQITNQCEQAN